MSDIVPAGQSPFDAIRRVDEQGNEYWLARDLAKLLKYTRFDDFLNAIERAKEDIEQSDRDVTTHLRKIPQKSTGGRPGADYELSAYACRLIVMAARTRDTAIASKARTYFSDKVDEAELLELAQQVADDPIAEVAQRIARRQELTEANKALLERAEAAGVITPKQRAIFMDWGYQGLYAGERENDIHARKELPPREAISSWMGAIETMANVLRAIIAKRRMDVNNVRTVTAANYTHYLSGQTVRDFLLREGIQVEELPTPAKSYKQIVKEEAARIAEEERLEALAEADRQGLWGQLLPPEGGEE